MMDEEKNYGYPKEKIDLIVSSPVEELMQLLDEISVSDARTFLNNYVLLKFVVSKYKNEKNNLIKFGKETKENYCKALKGEIKGFFMNSKHTQKVTPQEIALDVFSRVILAWSVSNAEINKIGTIPKLDGKPDYNQLIKILLKEKNKVSRETLSTLYRFSPISTSKKIEKEIKTAPYRLALLNKVNEKDDRDKNLEKLNSRVKELESELKNKKDYDEIKQAKKDIEKELIENSKKHVAQIDELKKEHKDELAKQIAILKDDNEKKLAEQKEDFYKEIKNLQEKYADYDQIKKDKENLKNENYELRNKKTPSGDFEKMQKNYEDKLQEKQKELDKFSDYEDIKRENDKLRNWKCITTDNLKNLIRYESQFKQDLKKMVISDKALCEFIIKKIPELKEEVVLEVANRRDQRNIDKELKINTNRTVLSNEYDVTIKSQEYMHSSSRIALLSDTDPDKFISNLSQEIDGSEDYILDLYDKMNNFFVVLNNGKELRAWKNAQDEFDYKIHYVRPDFDWLSYKDWFGYFKDDGSFIPSATGISDYYKELKNNPNIPMGIVVFRDYNRVMPSIYLETFIKNIEEKQDGISLINPNIKVNKEDDVYRNIKKLDNLKFVFIKKSDKNNSFETPDFMKQYELKYTSNLEGINE